MAIFKAANGSRRANDHRPADDPAAVAVVTFFAISKSMKISFRWTPTTPSECKNYVLNAVAVGDDYLFGYLR
jgi:hypothetical protein